MSSQHAGVSLTVRPDRQVKEGADAALAARGREMQAFVVACLVALAADPDGFLAALAPYWPAPKLLGRPRRDQERGPDPV
jgi:hypothetical protein